MLETEYRTILKLIFTMVIELSELEQLMDRLRQLQLQLKNLYQENHLRLKQ